MISLLRAGYIEWYKIDWIYDKYFNNSKHSVSLIAANGSHLLFDISEIIKTLKEFKEPGEERIIRSPNQFIPRISLQENIQVQASSIEIIKQIKANNLLIETIRWQDLEDIMAEIYKNWGFRVLQTKRTRDGGRDLGVQGELMPGFDLKMAVEITTQKYVDKNKVAKALIDNRDYPMVMVATTGQFSVGVKNKSASSDYQLRLNLADKNDILGWIQSYSNK